MYDEIASSYNELHGEEQERKLKKLLRGITLTPGMKVADIGCGTAHLSKFFSEQEYVGIDPSNALLEEAPRDIQVVQGKGEQIPLPNNSQDLVLSLTALHNYDDYEQGIQELARIAKDLLVVGVLRKAPEHDAITELLQKTFSLEQLYLDSHDTLFVLHKA